MKKSELKNIIKEVISEITVTNPNLNDLDRMLMLNGVGEPIYIEDFINYDTFEEWNEANEDNEPEGTRRLRLSSDYLEEKAEYIRLARIYFDWKKKGLIYVDQATDGDEVTTNVFSKPYKRIIKLGIGWCKVLIILTTF